MQEQLHPALQLYIDMKRPPPFPRGWPRGGGLWDQDPILVQHFRMIQEYEIQWKETQENLERMKGQEPADFDQGGGGDGLGDALDQYLETLDEDGTF